MPGISHRQGYTQYCHNAILHQFHWVCTEGDAFNWLLGCHHNFKWWLILQREQRELKTENWQWFPFFLYVLFSFLSFFWQCNGGFCLWMFWGCIILCFLSEQIFYDGWIHSRQALCCFLQTCKLCDMTCLDKACVHKYSHQKFNQLSKLTYKGLNLSVTFYES